MTTSVQENKIVHDSLNNKFEFTKDMCEYYHVEYMTYISRLKSGWSLSDTLFIGRKDEHLKVKQQIYEGFYKILYDNNETIWSAEEIYDYLSKKGETCLINQ